MDSIPAARDRSPLASSCGSSIPVENVAFSAAAQNQEAADIYRLNEALSVAAQEHAVLGQDVLIVKSAMEDANDKLNNRVDALIPQLKDLEEMKNDLSVKRSPTPCPVCILIAWQLRRRRNMHQRRLGGSEFRDQRTDMLSPSCDGQWQQCWQQPTHGYVHLCSGHAHRA